MREEYLFIIRKIILINLDYFNIFFKYVTEDGELRIYINHILYLLCLLVYIVIYA